MIRAEHGVKATVLDTWDLPGVTRIVMSLRWQTEPGWVELSFEQPVLCMVVEEIGGRCQVRMCADRPVQGEYFGTGHLSLIATGQPVAIHATEMLRARLVFYLFDLAGAHCLSPAETRAIVEMQSRYMFRNEPVQVCAEILGRHDKSEGDSYGFHLARALIAALHGVACAPLASVSPFARKLTGNTMEAISTHILDHLDQPVTVEALAHVASIPMAQFGAAFRDATSLSVQRWQMDARVRRAQRLMIDTPAECLAKVAALAGFSDQGHLSRVFVEIVGTTPTAWIHQHR